MPSSRDPLGKPLTSWLAKSFDLVINLEDDPETAAVLKSVRAGRLFGACLNGDGKLGYTPDSSRWFDLSLLSVYGREKADALKFENRRSYQELIFEGSGMEVRWEEYCLPSTARVGLKGRRGDCL